MGNRAREQFYLLMNANFAGYIADLSKYSSGKNTLSKALWGRLRTISGIKTNFLILRTKNLMRT